MTAIATTLRRGIFLDGEVQPLAGETMSITHPGDGSPVGQVTKATAEDVDRAVRSADRAFRE